MAHARPIIIYAGAEPLSARQKVDALAPRSIRFGREIGVMMLIFIEALAYTATSPIILPFALLYFGGAWIAWRCRLSLLRSGVGMHGLDTACSSRIHLNSMHCCKGCRADADLGI